jgi:hypothetical protein
MHELLKIKESQHFFDQMKENINDREKFIFSLSAFLSASRSVLQSALNETESIPGGQHWYNSKITGSAVLRYFRDKRNISIHEEPVTAVQETNIAITEQLSISDAVFIRVRDKNNSIIEERSSLPEVAPARTEIPPIVTHIYKFSDWSGPEDVLTLAKSCIDDLQAMINDGITRCFITG